MSDASSVIGRGLIQHYERVRQKAHELVDPLSTAQIWQKPYPYGNTIGHLLLHLTGNLNYYVGTRIVGTGYVRDRPKEFADTAHRDKDDVLSDFDRAVTLVVDTIGRHTDADWSAVYTAVGADDVENRFSMLLRCAAHADHHIGQMIYLCKQLATESK